MPTCCQESSETAFAALFGPGRTPAIPPDAERFHLAWSTDGLKHMRFDLGDELVDVRWRLGAECPWVEFCHCRLDDIAAAGSTFAPDPTWPQMVLDGETLQGLRRWAGDWQRARRARAGG